jgi:hypothetical protein
MHLGINAAAMNKSQASLGGLVGYGLSPNPPYKELMGWELCPAAAMDGDICRNRTRR